MKKVFKGFTYKQLEDAFDMVKNVEHWKNPISAVICPTKREVVIAAIEFYAYGDVDVTETEAGLLWIEAPGYWAYEEMYSV